MSSETPTKDKASSNQTKTIVITVVAVIVFAAAAGNYLKNKKSTVETDSDRDGIVDSQDKCPDENGPVEFMGCPENSYAAQEETPAVNSAANQQFEDQTTRAEKPTGISNPAESPRETPVSKQEVSFNDRQVAPIQQQEMATPEPAEVTIKNVAAKLKTDSGQNKISWNSELSKAKDLLLTISTASGLNFKKDVTGLNSYTFNPGSGEWQGKKCTVTLSSSDPKISIDNSKLPNTFFNCSAD